MMSKKTAKLPVEKLAVGVRQKPLIAPSAPSKKLDVFDNPAPQRDYHIHMQITEFTCLCPLTGQPDFAHITIDYIADKLCLELKALKMYMWSFRDEGVFHERVTNEMLEAFVSAINPRFMRVTAKWYVRGRACEEGLEATDKGGFGSIRDGAALGLMTYTVNRIVFVASMIC
jgi:7-cyano-7-deazaguanine reductase